MTPTDQLKALEKQNPHSHLFQSGSISNPDNDLDISPHGQQIHRAVASLFVEGKAPSAIAQRLNLDEGKVRLLLRQEHCVEVIRELVSAQGSRGVKEILRAVEVDTILKMIEIRDDPLCARNVQLQACTMLLETHRGKTPYSSGDEDQVPQGGALVEQISALDEQIRKLQKASGD